MQVPGIRSNPAETSMTENSIRIGISNKKSRDMLDRRVSVAPMMDWTDAPEVAS